MGTTIQQLASRIQARVVGEGAAPLHGASPIEDARPGDVTFAEHHRAIQQLARCQASAVIVSESLAVGPEDLPSPAPTLLVVPDAMTAFVQAVRYFLGEAPPPEPGTHPLAWVDPSAAVDPTCTIGPHVSVGAGAVLGARCHLHSGVVVGAGCRLGDDVVLHPHVVLYERTQLGHRVVIHAGSVLGADGFGYRHHEGRNVKVPQTGWVEVGDDVEIGASATIDRGTFSATRIGAGTKIDNHVQIAHNCRIGKHNLIASQVGMAGSCKTGDYVMLAGQVGVADHITIGEQAVIGGQSGVVRNIPPRERLLGTPALSERITKRIWATFHRYPTLLREIRRIQEHLGLAAEEEPGAPGAPPSQRAAG